MIRGGIHSTNRLRHDQQQVQRPVGHSCSAGKHASCKVCATVLIAFIGGRPCGCEQQPTRNSPLHWYETRGDWGWEQLADLGVPAGDVHFASESYAGVQLDDPSVGEGAGAWVQYRGGDGCVCRASITARSTANTTSLASQSKAIITCYHL